MSKPAEVTPQTFTIGGHEMDLLVSDEAFLPNATTDKIARQIDVPPGSDVLDLGCGVGPLSIYLAKEGAGHVDAVDIVPQAVELAKLNVQAAGVADRVTVMQGDLFEPVQGKKYDIVVNDVSGIAEGVARISPWYPNTVPSGGDDGAEVVLRMFDEVLAFLKPTGRSASTVIDPDYPQRRLALMIDGEEDFVAVDDDPARPPIPFKAAEVVEMQPRWEHIGRALADAIGFDFGAWENQGHIRRIGSTQDPFGRVSPVLLFVPPGHLGDYHALFRELSIRTESTVLLPTSRWLTAEMESLRIHNRLEFVDLAERLAQIEAQPAARVPLPVINKGQRAATPKVNAVIHAGNGLTWSQVTIEIAGNQTIHLKAPGQDGSHTFSRRSKFSREHPLGILMTLAAKGEWRNPPGSSPDYDRVSKAFQRLQHLLRALVPLPGKPFRKSAGAFVPLFQVRLHAALHTGSSE